MIKQLNNLTVVLFTGRNQLSRFNVFNVRASYQA